MDMIDTGRRGVLSIGSAAALFALVSAPAARAQSGSDITAANKRKVEAALAAWSNGTGNIMDLLSDDVRWTIVGNSLAAGTTVGKKVSVEKVLAPFGARFAKSSDKFRPVEIKGVYADGDMVIAYFDGRGTANDGKPYVNSYAWFLKMKGGVVVDGTAFFDSIAFDDLWTRVTP